MKNNFLKYYITAFFFCSSFMIYAQPGSGSDNGGIDDDGSSDTTPAPIDDYVVVLALVGLALVFIKVRPIITKNTQLN